MRTLWFVGDAEPGAWRELAEARRWKDASAALQADVCRAPDTVESALLWAEGRRVVANDPRGELNSFKHVKIALNEGGASGLGDGSTGAGLGPSRRHLGRIELGRCRARRGPAARR